MSDKQSSTDGKGILLSIIFTSISTWIATDNFFAGVAVCFFCVITGSLFQYAIDEIKNKIDTLNISLDAKTQKEVFDREKVSYFFHLLLGGYNEKKLFEESVLKPGWYGVVSILCSELGQRIPTSRIHTTLRDIEVILEGADEFLDITNQKN